MAPGFSGGLAQVRHVRPRREVFLVVAARKTQPGPPERTVVDHVERHEVAVRRDAEVRRRGVSGQVGHRQVGRQLLLQLLLQQKRNNSLKIVLVEWPRGEAGDCKSPYTGSNPVSTSNIE